MKLPKLANWLSKGDLEKYQKQARANEQTLHKLQKMESELAKVKNDCQQYQKELIQAKARLQIERGLQIELGETQLKLKQVEAEALRYKQELTERQQQYELAKSKLQQTRQASTESRDWLQQLKTPILVTEIVKTLPKQNFETLWGFGISTPTVGFTITTGAILVKGWVLGKKALAETVEISDRGERILETPVTLHSPTVIQQYPDIPTASKSGFEFSLSVVGIEKAELSLTALLSDRTQVPLCNFILKPQLTESNDT